MKRIADGIINTINIKRNSDNYEWSEILFKSVVFGIATYLFIVVDMIIYGFLTR